MAEPLIWGAWPLVADLNNDSATAMAAMPDETERYQPASARDGEEGLKRRAACDECRTECIVADLNIGANSMQASAS
jgi:hypothetical protein